MQKDILLKFAQLEQAIAHTGELATTISTRVERETARLDAIAEKLAGLRGLLNQAGEVAGEIRLDLEEKK